MSDGLRELVKKWREPLGKPWDARYNVAWQQGERTALKTCADELESALGAVAVPPSGEAMDAEPMNKDALIREIEQVLKGITAGAWELMTEHCDCGDGYGCSHGEYPYAIVTDTPQSWWVETRKKGPKPDEPLPSCAFQRSEISEFTMEDARFIAAAPRLLRAALSALRGEAVAAPPAGEGVALIAAERRRQVEAEGWTPAHDDTHGDFALSAAAACYALAVLNNPITRETTFRRYWPWERSWWKPSDDPIRNLVKAGALIAAEIDRLKRAAPPTTPEAR